MEKKLYEKITLGGVELRARLGVKDAIDLERFLGESVIEIMQKTADKGTIPSWEFIISVLTFSLRKYEHGYDMDKVFDLVDQEIEAGQGFEYFLEMVIKILQVSGFFKNPAQV